MRGRLSYQHLLSKNDRLAVILMKEILSVLFEKFLCSFVMPVYGIFLPFSQTADRAWAQ